MWQIFSIDSNINLSCGNNFLYQFFGNYNWKMSILIDFSLPILKLVAELSLISVSVSQVFFIILGSKPPCLHREVS